MKKTELIAENNRLKAEIEQLNNDICDMSACHLRALKKIDELLDKLAGLNERN